MNAPPVGIRRSDLIGFSFTVAGEKQLDVAMLALKEATSDLSGLWPDVDALLRQIEEEQFSSKGKRGGEEWVKLSDEYAAWKARRYPGRPILVLKGKLKESLTQSGGGHIFIPGKLGMAFGTKVPYAVYHQTGTRYMPARPPIKLLKTEDAVKIQRLIQEYLYKSGQGYRRTLL